MTATLTTDPGDGLSTLIRTATAEAHEEAERAPFVQDLMGGRLPLSDYARLVVQHRAIYTTLEAAVAASTDPDLAPFLAPELVRLPAIEADLAVLAERLGPPGVDDLAVVDATRAYCDHLDAVRASWPGGLLAHHYVRYLGDLSGGQVIGRVLQRVFDLPGDDGTRFYRFPDIASPKAFKVRYRTLLDELGWGEAARDRLIDEVNLAYRLNADVFLELAPLPVLASTRHARAEARRSAS